MKARKQEIKAYMKAKHTNIQRSYVFADLMYIFSDFIEIALQHGCSPVNLLHIFITPFLKNTSQWLLLKSRNTQRNIKISSMPTIKTPEECQ